MVRGYPPFTIVAGIGRWPFHVDDSDERRKDGEEPRHATSRYAGSRSWPRSLSFAISSACVPVPFARLQAPHNSCRFSK